MRIEQSDVQLSASSWLASLQQSRQRISITAPPTPQPTAPTADTAVWGSSAVDGGGDGDVMGDPRLQLMLWAAELIVGHKIHLFHLPARGGAPVKIRSSAPNGPAQPAPQVRITTTTTRAEAEQLTFRAQGTVQTGDGRQIAFQLQLTMARASVSVATSNGKSADPLVVNLDGTGVRLLPARAPFDLNGDGQSESVPLVAPGSGLLFADRNGDGVANDGTELFGPQTGNGFAELAAQDADHNGWIDEGDPVFGQLRVWVQDPSGPGKTYSLADLGIGALSVAPVATPFQLQSTTGELLGQIRNSGVYLNDSGRPGVIQQIDVAA